MDTSEMETRLRHLESKVNHLESLQREAFDAHNQRLGQLLEVHTRHTKDALPVHAWVQTLRHTVIELAERAGTDPDRVHEVLLQKFRYFQARAFAQLEDIAPDSAARLDERTPEEAGEAPDECPSIFEW